MDDDSVGLIGLVGGIGAFDDFGDDAVERLVGFHDVEVDFGCDAEELVDLVEHLAVLACNDGNRGKPGVGFKRLDDGRDFNRLRACAVNGHDLLHRILCAC